MSSTGATPMTEEERAFLQRRVGVFGLWTGGLFTAFYLFRLLIGHGPAQIHMHYHALAAACFLATWVGCRGAVRSERWIRAVEALGFLGGGVLTSLMAGAIPIVVRPEYIVVLASGIIVFARAIYVPSTALRTFVLGGLLGVNMVACMYSAYAAYDATLWLPVIVDAYGDGARLATRAAVRFDVVASTAMWWSTTLAASTAASRVIYGLRKEVRDVKRLGQYRLEAKLGEGGMGAVYRARHAMLARPAAIKLLHPDAHGAASVQRFEREVVLTAKLRHPNTVTVFDYGRTPEGVFYYAMELIDGATLEAIVSACGPMPPSRVLLVIDRVAAALVEAHGIGLIHRDLKPANIMLQLLHPYGGAGDAVKVVDFGLVKEIETGGATPGLTAADTIQGTPHYMAPEAITRPDAIGAASDIYAVGAVAYFALTGAPVFEAASIVEVCGHHLHTPPVPPSTRRGAPVPEDIERLVLDCLAKDPAMRPQSALELQARARACAAWGAWTDEDARAFWRERGDLVRDRAERSVAAGEAITVDIARMRTVAAEVR
ncbi:MAG: serine/threonine protein kinase [Myxococcales bacterium]|nr:serine/threonine protein kinase [Myxococcales bacterium]